MGEARLGEPVADWRPPEPPGPPRMEGAHAVLHRLRAEHHAEDLHRANAGDDRMWDYLPYGPFETHADYRRWVADHAPGADPCFYAIGSRATKRLGGVASFLRIAPSAGTIEVGHIALAGEVRGTVVSSEAMFLMMAWAFGAGYRRYEWKCDALNLASRRAAQRLGFSFEGVFRQAGVVKGRNRDTAWFAVIDKEWPALRRAFETWLAPSNFDSAGRQIIRLGDLTAPIRVADDPALSRF